MKTPISLKKFLKWAL